MSDVEDGGYGKIINFKNRRLRKKYKVIFKLINKLSALFHRNIKIPGKNKQDYKRSVNH